MLSAQHRLLSLGNVAQCWVHIMSIIVLKRNLMNKSFTSALWSRNKHGCKGWELLFQKKRHWTQVFSACNCLFDSRNCLLTSLILGSYYKLNWPKRASAVYWLLGTLLYPWGEGPAQNFCHLFISAFWSIKGVYFLQNANNLNFKLFFRLYTWPTKQVFCLYLGDRKRW